MLKRNIGEPNSFTSTTLKSKVDYTAIAFFSIFNNTKKGFFKNNWFGYFRRSTDLF